MMMSPLLLVVLCLARGVFSQESTAAPNTTTVSPDLQDRWGSPQSPINVKYAWSRVEFIYSNPSKMNEDLIMGRYIPEDVIVIDVDAYKGPDGIKKEFVTTPSFRPGIPFSLSVITSEKASDGSPKLLPFPSEAWHARTTCDGIISAFRIRIDSLGRLWVMDTGKLETSTNRRTRCGPQLLAFDLNKNNTLIRKTYLPIESCNDQSFFVNLEVEIGPSDTWVYMSDPNNHRMAVYTMSKNTIHYVQHPFFFPDPHYSFYYLNGVNFTLIDGILGLALTKEPGTGADVLFFNGLSSGRENYVRTDTLKDPDTADLNVYDYKSFPTLRKTHVTVKSITKQGVMVYPSLDDNSLMTWDIKTEFIPRNFKLLARDRQNLQFPTGMKIVDNELYVLTSRLQNPIGLGSPARGEVNYRVITAPVGNLQGTGIGSKPNKNQFIIA